MTIRDIALNSDHDLYLDGSDLATTNILDEAGIVKQRLAIRLQFLFEEWFLDNRVGLPYTQFIFEQDSSIEDIYTLFKQEILNTPDVTEITELELTPVSDDRGLRVDFSVNHGTITDTVEVTI